MSLAAVVLSGGAGLAIGLSIATLAGRLWPPATEVGR
jgi:hypothetical protein